MKTAFLCSSLEIGRDGVGDYSRRLAGELIRQNHPSVAIALNDLSVSEVFVGNQEVEGTTVPILRLPGSMPWNQRITEARDWLGRFNPDWLSLQFVPFGFHPKGLCFGLGKNLASLNKNAAWHVMFHELWLGLGNEATSKHRAIGCLQRMIAMDILARLHPRVVNTQAEAYRLVLLRENIEASILPLFGNIPRADGDGWKELLEPLVNGALEKPRPRSELYLAGVLGSVAPEWKAEKVVDAIYPHAQRFQKRLVLVFFGKSDLTADITSKLKISLQGRAEVVLAGERPSKEISKILQAIDLGIATTPRQVIQKSGSTAAMLEHGLPVLVVRDDWHLRGSEFPSPFESSQLLSLQEFGALKTLPIRTSQSGESGVRRVARQMLAAMDSPFDHPASRVEMSGAASS